MDNKQAALILQQALSEFSAKINQAQSNPLQEIQPLEIDLSIARSRDDAMKISFPFKMMMVEQATDINTYIQVLPESKDNGVGDVKLGLKDKYGSDLGVRQCYLYWPAQAGKKVVLKFFTTSNFVSGSLIVDQRNIPVTEEVGFARGDLDGFTRKVYFYKKHDALALSCYDTENPDYNNGTLFGSPTFFQIPQGYYGIVMGIEMTVIESTALTHSIRLLSLEDGTSSLANDTGTTDRYLAYMGLTSDYSVGRHAIRLISVNYALGAARKAPILLAGEIPYVSINLFDSLSAGHYEGILMIRLVPIVGQ